MLKKIRTLAGKINNINHINAGASLPTVATLCMNLTNNNACHNRTSCISSTAMFLSLQPPLIP